MLTTLILLLTGVDEPVPLLHARHRAARRPALRPRPARRCSRVLLVGVYFWALSVRAGVDAIPTRSRPTSACPRCTRSWPPRAPRRGACSTARPRPRRSWPSSRARAGRRGASARGWRATCTTRSPRRSRASASPRSRCRAGSSATPRARRPRRAGSPRTRARRRARRARSSSACARTRASRCRCSDARSRCRAALGARGRASSSTSRSRTSASCTRRRARELEWILREALANVQRHARAAPVGVRLRRLGARAVLTVPTTAPGSTCPTTSTSSRTGRHFGVGGMRERALLAGGDLSVESAPGEGCVLSVWVPTEIVPASRRPSPTRRGRAPAPASDTRPRPLRPRLHLAMIRVLLVDDNAIVRRGIAQPARRGRRDRGRGRGGRRARGDRGRARAAPDVVCLDVRMPVMDGVEAAGPLSRARRAS